MLIASWLFNAVLASLALNAMEHIAVGSAEQVGNTDDTIEEQTVLGVAPGPGRGARDDWRPTDPKNMSPCPGMNALVNHGHLNKTGMTQDQIESVLTNVMQADKTLASYLASSAMPLGHDGVLDLKDLAQHNKIEHDASLTRHDDYFGDSTHFNETLYSELRSHAFKDDEVGHRYINRSGLANFRRAREADSRETNPQFKFDFKEKTAAYAEAAVLYIVFSDDTGKGIRLDWCDVFFREERLPYALGWEPRPVTKANMIKEAALIYGSTLM